MFYRVAKVTYLVTNDIRSLLNERAIAKGNAYKGNRK